MIPQTQAIDQLIAASERLIADCDRISDDRWQARRKATAWSPAEVVEHVALASANIGAVFDDIADRPLASKPRSLTDEEIPFVFYGGDEPPNIAKPTGTWVDRVEACTLIRGATTDVCARALRSEVDLRTVAGTHPLFGRMDGVQWLIFAFAHVERHRTDLRAAMTADDA